MSGSQRLPDRPDLRHLRDQARDLLRTGAASTLAQAQFRIAQSYGFASWPKLKSHVESLQEHGSLKEAIDREDLDTVREMMTRRPDLHRAPLGYNRNGPLTWVAECRVPRRAPTAARLEMARWMIENGSDVHQGGDGPLIRAALADERIPMLELLVGHGADVNARWDGRYPIICAPCETLSPEALRWLLEHGADLGAVADPYGHPVAMVLGTYSRNPEGRAACLEVFIDLGYELPDTPTMALHRRRRELLEAHLARDPGLLSRRFALAEIYPPVYGLKPEDGLHVTPLDGVTLLHLAIELDDLEMAEWLLERGADPNARAVVDGDGFGGHTPLFHAVVSLGRHDDEKARLLLRHGADPTVRASVRKQLRHMGDPEKEKPREFRDVTAAELAWQFQEPAWVCRAAIELFT